MRMYKYSGRWINIRIVPDHHHILLFYSFIIVIFKVDLKIIRIDFLASDLFLSLSEFIKPL